MYKCIETPHTQAESTTFNGGMRRVEGRDMDLPNHREREAELHRLGVNIGTDGLTPA